MKILTHYATLFFFLFIISNSVFATSYTWTGSTSTSWSVSTNWSPQGLPGSLDSVQINSTTRQCVLDTTRTVYKFTISVDTLFLDGYTLTVNGTFTGTSGKIINGILKCRGSVTAFNGTLIDAEVDHSGGVIRFSGSVFNKKVAVIASSASSTSTSAGGSTFNDSLNITFSSNGVYLKLATTTGDTYNGPVVITNTADHEIMMADAGTSYFNNNLIVNNTSTGGVIFGNNGGSSELASGKTISIGSSGFTKNYLTLKNFTQVGSTSQSLTLTSSGVLTLTGCTFNGNLTVSGPGFLLKNNTFNGTSSFSKSGDNSMHCDGGNTYNGNVTFSNSGSAGRIRLSTTTSDNYFGDATFQSTGQDVQVAYGADVIFTGNISLNNSHVTFNAGSGMCSFQGSASQVLSGSATAAFKNLAMNKSGGTLTLSTPISVDNLLSLIGGNIITTSTNIINLKNGGYFIGGSSACFISGPFKKTGNSAFKFPIGKGTTYMPLEISAPSTTTSEFTAEFFDSGQTLGSSMDTTITFVSDCKYWKLDRNSGTSNVSVHLTWAYTDCDYISVRPAHIALWNGTKWTDKGEAVVYGNLKQTSTTQSSFGYFAIAYALQSGDAPQYPVNLNVTSGCNDSQILFSNKVAWYSFKSDSALIKIAILFPDSSKRYAPLENVGVYEAYQVGISPNHITSWDINCDSLLTYPYMRSTDIDTSQNYLLKVTRFVEGECDGIYDTLDYYLDVCIKDLRMNTGSQTFTYNSVGDLTNSLGTIDDPGFATSGDVILAASPNVDLTINPGTPMFVVTGVTFAGDYSLNSTPYTLNLNTITTSPYGTLININNHALYGGSGLPLAGYGLIAEPGAIIQNIRFHGAMPGYLDYNNAFDLRGGIKFLSNSSNPVNNESFVRDCEVSDFSYAGIFSDPMYTPLNIESCYIHNIKGDGGRTTPKGYGIWLKGTNDVSTMSICTLSNCIFNQNKEGIDLQPYPLNVIIDHCTFGEVFFNENIVRHDEEHNAYPHPLNSYNSCDIYTGHDPCASLTTNSGYTITEKGESGNVTITNSIFLQPSENINLPYPVSTLHSNDVYSYEITNNTFAKNHDLPGTLDCNFGGYARVMDNYIEECVWEYEHNTLATNSTKPIFNNEGNSFSYERGTSILSGCPQPPESIIEITNYEGLIPDISGGTRMIPYFLQGSGLQNTEIELSLNSGANTLTHIVYPHPNNGSNSGSYNTSANNTYRDAQFINSPASGTITHTFTMSDWNTALPGLYGIDVVSVNAGSNNETSPVQHLPIIIAPNGNHKLIFNIKDSYYADLYGDNSPTGVLKQVELNGVPIWHEDIAEGGDGWEYVSLSLWDDPDIIELIHTNGQPNTITFSLAMPDPANVSSSQVRGVNIWIDDIYLQESNGIGNLIQYGDLELTKSGTLSSVSTNPYGWYFKNASTWSNCDSQEDLNAEVKTEAFFAIKESRSGLKAIRLYLKPIDLVQSPLCTTYDNFSTPDNPSSGEMISAAIDFDYRDFLTCDDLKNNSLFDKFVDLDESVTNATYTNEFYLIDNDISIPALDELIFNGCQIAVSSPSLTRTVIEVNHSGSDLGLLQLYPSSTYPTQIFGCDNMWQGIHNIGGKVIIDGSTNRMTQISDAINAIESDQGEIYIQYAIFKNNSIGLYLRNGNFNLGPGLTEGISIAKFINPVGKLRKHPLNNATPFAGIQIDNVTEITIGAISVNNPSGFKNYFSDAVYGINILNSNAEVINCEFSNFVRDEDTHPCWNCGSGIYALNNSLTSKTLTIGNESNADKKNEFSNSLAGIITKGNYDLGIFGNEFKSLPLGIRCNNNSEEIAIKAGNSLDTVNTGIVLFRTRGNVDISSNQFGALVASNTPDNTSFNNTAITIQNANGNNSNTVSIYGNDINDYRIGIHANSVRGLNIGRDASNGTIDGNNLYYQISFTHLENYHGGVWLQNCPLARIVSNSISNSSFNIHDNFRGIDIDNSVGCDVNCNTISNIGVGINFFENCGGSQLRKNIISEYNRGIWLTGSLGASIDAIQGMPGALNDETAWDNEWHVDLNNDIGQLKVDGTPFQGLQINWYHQQPTNDHTFIYSPFPWNANMINAFPSQNSGATNCTDFLVSPNLSRVYNFGSIVGDSLQFNENEESNLYKSKKSAYLMMLADTNIVRTGDSLDIAFINFYNQLDTGNIGRFLRVDSLINELSDSAAAILASIIPENDIETSLKSFYELFINKIIADDTLSSSDSTSLSEWISNGTILSGDAYYYSLSTLFVEIHPEISEVRNGNIDNFPSKSNFIANLNRLYPIVFPNPTSQKATVKMSDYITIIKNIQLFNAQGKILLEFTPNQPNYSLYLNEITSGLYILKITDSNQEYYSKLQVIK